MDDLISANNNEVAFPIQIFAEEELSGNKTEIGSASALLNQLPGLIGSTQLNGTYRVVFPEGATGKLMQMRNGLNTTAIVNDSNKIVAQAGLQSLSNLATPFAVFSAMSMVTGQYFMAQINKSITTLSENIEEVQRQIDISEEATVFSADIFLKEIKNDWNLILSSTEFKSSVISNILKTINDLTSVCYYFENRLNSKMIDLERGLTARSPKIEDSIVNDISRSKDFFKYAYELRSFFKIMLFFLTTGITVNSSEDIKIAFKNDETLIFSNTIKQLNAKIDDVIDLLVKAPTVKLQQKAKMIQSIIVGVRKITRDKYSDDISTNIMDTIDCFEKLDKEGQEFYISDGKLFICN